MWLHIKFIQLCNTSGSIKQWPDVREGGADKSIESLVWGVHPPETIAILVFTMFQSSPELIYRYNLSKTPYYRSR